MKRVIQKTNSGKKRTFSILNSQFSILLMITLISCNGCQKSGDDGGSDSDSNGSVSLSGLKKAAKDAGYEVEDSYFWSGDNIVGGFTVVFSKNGTNSHIPVLQFKDKASADANAKRELDAGYNYPIQNGKFLTFASARNSVIKDEEEKTFLENLINGRPLK